MFSLRAPSITLKNRLAEWWPILLGLLALYVPTFYDLAHGIWNNEEYAHGPIILMVVIYLFWQQKERILNPVQTHNRLTGWISLLLGFLIYVIGRSQDILIFEVGSLIPILAGVILCMRNYTTLRALWFPLLFIFFMIPLPSILVDTITQPLKQAISVIAENILYWFGYPIARSGVIITIGPYQLLVADACSGLHSMFSLSALGLLYLHLVRHRSPLRNTIIIASILPIAFIANIIRVIIIILVTFHLGDAAGQGFIHGFAGIVLFITALISLFVLDSGLLEWVFKPIQPVAA